MSYPKREAREYNKENRIQKKARLKTKYGLSLENYDSLVDFQGNVCAICKEPETKLNSFGTPRDLAVDHCHNTEQVRGLLCHNCNIGLGMFRDNIDNLLAAVVYLGRSEEEKTKWVWC